MTERTDLFQPATLPAQGAPGATLMDIAICPGSAAGAEDRRILVNPSGSQALFPSITDYNAMSNSSQYLDIDQALWSRIVAVRGDFQYDGHNAQGNPVFLHQSVCREANSVSGTGADARYRLFARTPPEIYNPPTQAYPGVSFTFHPREIQLLVQGLPKADGSGTLMAPLATLEYATDYRSPHVFYINPNLAIDRVRAIEAAIRNPQSPIAPDRREAMAEAFHQAFGNQFGTLDFQRRTREDAQGMRWEMRLSMGSMLVAQILTTAYALGKGAPITWALTFLPRAIFTPLIEGAINVFTRRPRNYDWRWTRNFYGDVNNRFRYRHIPTLTKIGTNLTEIARRGDIRPVADPTTPQVAQRIENTIKSQFNTMSVLVEGPPGWGKEVVMRELARRNPNITFIQVTPNGMQGGTMYRGQLEQRMVDIPKEIAAARRAGQQVVLDLDEFHEALSAGKNMEQTVSLLEQWKGEIARGEIRIIGFSTPRELLKARYIAGYYNDPASRARLTPQELAEVEIFERQGVRQSIELRALLNRFERVVLPPRPMSDIELIIRDTIAVRQEKYGLRIEMDAAAITRIARLSESAIASEGYIPRTGLAIFNGVVDANAGNSSTVRVTLDMVNTYVETNFPDISQRFNADGTPQPPQPPPQPPRPAGQPPRPADRASRAQPAPVTVRTGWEEVLTHRVNDRAVYESLTRVDSRLAEFYRERISTSADPVTTMSDLIARVSAVNPNALTGALEVAAREGLSISQMSERAVFELITLSAERARPEIVRDIDATRRSQFARTFETEVRTRRGLEAREARPAEADRREEEGRRRRAPRSR